MTATNIFYNFVGFRYIPPLMHSILLWLGIFRVSECVKFEYYQMPLTNWPPPPPPPNTLGANL